MAESAALNSRQISRMHNKATSHGNPLSLSLNIYFTFPPRGKEKRSPAIVFPLFRIFLELATICEPYGEEYIPLPDPISSWSRGILSRSYRSRFPLFI